MDVGVHETHWMPHSALLGLGIAVNWQEIIWKIPLTDNDILLD